GAADPHRVLQHGLEYRLQLPWRTADDPHNLRGGGLLLQRLGERTRARVERLFQLDQRVWLVANLRYRLRSSRTNLAAEPWAVCAFERQGHLVGTVTGPTFRSAQLVNPNRAAPELAPFHTRSPRRRYSLNGIYGMSSGNLLVSRFWRRRT